VSETTFENLAGATFSPCRKYRTLLWRRWAPEKGTLLFVMLNPSTADEMKNDPTVERCQRRSVALGFGALEVVNLFALRATDPSHLYNHPAPVGSGEGVDNNRIIQEASLRAGMVICGWGQHGGLIGRGKFIASCMRQDGVKLHHLGLTKDGHPRHPLYVSYSKAPEVWL
jgi:hypothetical protein